MQTNESVIGASNRYFDRNPNLKRVAKVASLASIAAPIPASGTIGLAAHYMIDRAGTKKIVNKAVDRFKSEMIKREKHNSTIKKINDVGRAGKKLVTNMATKNKK